MYLMYVDESGDYGMPADGSPSNLFCLSGLVVHELRWRETMSDLLTSSTGSNDATRFILKMRFTQAI